MSQSWSSRLRQTLKARGAPAFLAASLVVGILVGVAAALMVVGIEWISGITESVVDWGAELREDGIGSEGRWVLLGLIPLGITIAWLIARRFGEEVESGGVTETMTGLSLHGGYLPTRTIPAKIAATITTLGFGGSGGREGPAAMIGGTIGSSLARFTRLGEDQIRSLIAAGAGAGIGASFAAPIAGMLFAMEVLLGNFAVRHLNAVVIASVAAAVTTRSLVGEDAILSAPKHGVLVPAELMLYVLLGLLAVAVGYLFLRILDGVDGWKSPERRPRWLRPVVAGVSVAAIGLVAPEALGTGQEYVAKLLDSTTSTDAVWWVVMLIAVAKMVTNALTRSGGGSAGTFMPSLFIGASLGTALAVVVSPIWGFSELDSGAFAIVGMAATFAAVARAPLTSILIVFEITGDYGLVLPLMLATSLATLLADRIHPESSYTMPLRRKGIHLLRREDIDLLDTVSVGEVMKWPGTLLPTTMTADVVDDILEESHHHGLPVVDDSGHLVGILTVSDVARRGGPSPDLTVEDIMTRNPITVVPSMPVSAALARMAALGVGRLPVVSDDDPTEFVGMFRRESVVRAYHHALGSTTDRHLYRERARVRTQPGAAFFDMPVMPDSYAHGKRVKELTWPEDATLVSIRRGTRVIIPHGDTIIERGDTITAFGSGDSRVELAYLLEPQPVVEEDAT
jgi:CIC family chloride channel protein